MTDRDSSPEVASAGGIPARAGSDPHDALGRFVRRFDAIGLGEIASRFRIAIGCALGLAVFAWMLSIVARDDLYDYLAWALTGVVGLAAVLVIASRTRGWCDVYEHGLRYFRGSHHHDVLWRRVSSVALDLTRRDATDELVCQRVAIVTLGGRSFVLDQGVRDIAELGEIVRRETQPFITRRVLDRLTSGHPIRFGPYARITSAGIVNFEHLTPWADIDLVQVQEGEIRIPPAGTWKYGAVDNAHALLPLIESISDEARKRNRPAIA